MNFVIIRVREVYDPLLETVDIRNTISEATVDQTLHGAPLASSSALSRQ